MSCHIVDEGETFDNEEHAYLRCEGDNVWMHGNKALKLPQGYDEKEPTLEVRREYTRSLLLAQLEALPVAFTTFPMKKDEESTLTRKDETDPAEYQAMVNRYFLRQALLNAIYTRTALRSHIQLDTKIQGRFNGCTILMLMMRVKFRRGPTHLDQVDYSAEDIEFQQWVCQTIREQQYDVTIADDVDVCVFSYLRDVYSTWCRIGEETFPHSLLSALMSSSCFHPFHLLSSSDLPLNNGGVFTEVPSLVRWIVRDIVTFAKYMSTRRLHLGEVQYMRFDLLSTLISEVKYQYAHHPRADWGQCLEEYLGDLFNWIFDIVYDEFDPQLLLDCLLLLPTESLIHVNVVNLRLVSDVDTVTRSSVNDAQEQFYHVTQLHYSSSPIRLNAYIILALERWQTRKRIPDRSEKPLE